jgi:hypothetical protein
MNIRKGDIVRYDNKTNQFRVTGFLYFPRFNEHYAILKESNRGNEFGILVKYLKVIRKRSLE